MTPSKILILDFGSQYTQLIARRIREAKVFAEIVPFHISLDDVRSYAPSGIILSGGPSSVYDPQAPQVHPDMFNLSIPVLGICYGMQIMAHVLGGVVAGSVSREYGAATLTIVHPSRLLDRMGASTRIWMSHGDRIEKMPTRFQVIAKTASSPVAAMADVKRNLYALQFHPEVVDTPKGPVLLKNFLFQICGCTPTWKMTSFLTEASKRVAQQIGDGHAICAVSGGVDSAVAAALVGRVIGDRLTCIFVDNGLLRKGEARQVAKTFAQMGFRYKQIPAARRFIGPLAGVTNPEKKRKIIGRTFIHIFEEEAKRASGRGVHFLVQGTLYPDVIESVSVLGPSVTIKSHHNVGGLPKRMTLQLVEPIKRLFKDEVRELGKVLGLPETLLDRHPFPGPGLAVRIVGEVTKRRLDLLREADAIFQEEIDKRGLHAALWQAFAVYLPIRSVGVMGDQRTYQDVIALRAVVSTDGMTADWAMLPEDLLRTVSGRITNEVCGINRVVLDVSSKPPSTIEWE